MEKVIKSLITVIIILIMLTYSSISFAAQSLKDLQSEQSSVEDKISETKEELEDLAHEKSETLQAVEKLITEISSYNKEINSLKTELSELNSKIKDAEKQIKEDEEQYAKEDLAMQERLVAMYKNGETSYLDYMFSSSNIVDFISSYYLISEIAEYDTQMLEKIQTHKEKIENQKNELESDKKKVEKTKTTLESKQNALKVAKSDKENYASKLSKDEKKMKEKLEELQETNDDLDKQIAKAKAAIEAAKKAAANKPVSGTPSGTQSSAGFIWPVNKGYRLTTGMYYRSGGYHGAADFSGAGIHGTPIYAVADGYVVASTAVTRNGRYISYGNYVLIAHYNGLYTLSAHMSKRSVSAGQTVSQGQVIGLVGSTGNSTGPHLHFEVRTGDGSYSSRVNPQNYLPMK